MVIGCCHRWNLFEEWKLMIKMKRKKMSILNTRGHTIMMVAVIRMLIFILSNLKKKTKKKRYLRDHWMDKLLIIKWKLLTKSIKRCRNSTTKKNYIIESGILLQQFISYKISKRRENGEQFSFSHFVFGPIHSTIDTTTRKLSSVSK